MKSLSPAAYNKIRDNLAIALLEVGAVRISPLLLKFNLHTASNPRPGPLTSEIVELAATCMQALLANAGLKFDAIASVPRAGDPLARALSRFSGKECITLEWQGEHITSMKAPASASVQEALLVDDEILTAHSKLEAIEALRDAGIMVNNAIVLIDYEHDGCKDLERYGCTLHSVFTSTWLLDFYVDTGKIVPRI
jgi:orotate phosphoribosyltransferase